MRHEELEKLIHRILTTEEEEIDCRQAAELIAQYVELELAGENVTRLLPEVAQHLRQCDDCYELHAVLREIAALEQAGALPSINELLEEIVHSEVEAGHRPQTDTLATPSETTNRPEWAPEETNVSSSSLPSHGTPLTKTPAIASDRSVKRPFWQRWPASWAWATTAVALLIAVGISVWAWRQTDNQAQADARHLAFIASADWVIRLKGTTQAPEAHGFIFVNTEHQRALVIAKGLHPLPRDQVYRVWVRQDDRFLSGGAFQVKRDAWETVVYVDFRETLTPDVEFMITRESGPEGATPASPPLLRGRQDY